MKKFLTAMLAVWILIASLPMTVHAAASASLTGPSVVRAGDTITLSFSAGGNIHGGTGTISFDSSQLTLEGAYTPKLSAPYAVEFNGNAFTFYDNSMTSPIVDSKTVFTATFRVNQSVSEGTVISVKVSNVVLSDGVADSNIGTCTYSVTVAPPLSGNADLATLTVGNASFTPGFSADNTSYSCDVPYSVSSLDISATAAHPGASVEIRNNYLTAGDVTYVSITVTAETGATKKYHIATFRAQDPNYVPSNVNTLDSLSVEGYALSPVFDPEKLEYAVYLPYETSSLTLSAQVSDGKASAVLPDLSAIPVGTSVYEIPVTAESGDVRTYSITVIRADVFPPVPTEPEVTEPVTEPTEPATEPTTAPTEPSTIPTTAPTEPSTVRTEPAPAPEAPKAENTIFWILGIAAAFAAGCGLTWLLLKKKK